MISDRYNASDLDVFTPEERKRFGDELNEDVAWQLLYRLEPALYERLIAGEQIHPAVLDWIPRVERCVEVGAGTGRLTKHLECDELIVVEPCEVFRERLPYPDVRDGFFDAIPVADDWADLVISCSAFKPDEAGLAEMERVSRSMVAIVWPNDVEWLVSKGFEYICFDGEMTIEFESLDEALEVAKVFYPDAVGRITSSCVPYEVIGLNPPRDIAFKQL